MSNHSRYFQEYTFYSIKPQFLKNDALSIEDSSRDPEIILLSKVPVHTLFDDLLVFFQCPEPIIHKRYRDPIVKRFKE